MNLGMIVSCSLAYSAVKCYLFTFIAPVISADIPASGWIIPTGEREIMCPPSVSTAAHISLIQSLKGESRRWKHSVETDCVKWQVGGCWFGLKYIYIYLFIFGLYKKIIPLCYYWRLMLSYPVLPWIELPSSSSSCFLYLIWAFYWNRFGLSQVCIVTSTHFRDITQDNHTVCHHPVQSN